MKNIRTLCVMIGTTILLVGCSTQENETQKKLTECRQYCEMNGKQVNYDISKLTGTCRCTTDF